MTSIGSSAFSGCSSLESITLPFVGGSIKTSSNTYQYSFGYIFGTSSYTGGVATEQYYYGSSTSSTTNNTYYIPSSLKNVTITGGNILYGAFYNCSNLTSVTIPDSVTSIGNSAFYGCSRLTSVTIPDSVTSIGSSAFESCWSLTSVTIPDSVTSIDNYAFSLCFSLTSVTIPDSVTSIGDGAFSGCDSLTSVTIPDSVMSIGRSAFSSCDNLTSVTIPDSVTSIGEMAFGSCRSLTSVTIPDSVTSIGNQAFESCRSITSVTIPDSVTNIGSGAFSYCDSLTSVTIPDSVMSIGERTFYNCSSLTSVTIPDSVTSIGRSAFSRCDNLTAIEVDENNAYYCDIDGVLFNKDKTTIISYPAVGSTTYIIPDSVTSIGDSAFQSCSSLTSVTIPDSVTSIGDWAFFSCRSLTSLTIPDSVTSIGEMAFGSCSSLTSVTIPDSVTSIGWGAFEYCSSLTSVTIPDSVTSIGDYAFYSCSSLTSVTIPDSVTSIGSSAFCSCSSLTSVTFETKNTTINSLAFYYCDNLKTICLYRNSTADSYLSSDKYTKIYLDDLTYTVTYDANGGSDAPEAQVKDYGVDLTLSADVPTLAGHTFKGWSTTTDGKVEYAAGATYTANADVTLYAVWEISENELTVDDKILTFNGFQLRKDEYNGLRFRFTADYTKMAELKKVGYEVVEFGTLMAATYKLESLDELVVAKNENGEYETLSIARMVPIYSGGKIVNKYITKTAEQLTFACTVINYTVNTFDLEVTVRGYTVIRDTNGNEYVVYTDYPNENYRSLSLERVCDELSAAGLIDTAANISYINVTAFKKEREALEA